MRFAIACMFVSAIGLSAGCSPTDAPESEAVEAQPNAEASSPAEPVTEQGVERPTTAGPVMDENSGIAVGQKAPSFRLKDQNGKVQSLDEFAAQGNVALVFYRSADW
jgi:hypothetical protein